MRQTPFPFAFVALALLVSAAGVVCPAAAAAQLDPEVERAREEALSGEFDQASARLEVALLRDDLSRQDLITMYEARVFISYAGGDRSALVADLERIAALDPEHSFDPNYYAAEVTDAFAETVRNRAGRLALEAEALLLASGDLEIRSEIHNDPGDLVQNVQIYGRAVGEDWERGEGSLRTEISGDQGAEYYAQAVGPGGAIVATHGSEGAPLLFEGEGGGAGEAVPLWVWIGGASVIVAAVIIIAAVAASGGVSDDTHMHPAGAAMRLLGAARVIYNSGAPCSPKTPQKSSRYPISRPRLTQPQPSSGRATGISAAIG
ncbi:MAG: hypothetical protein JRH11_27095 [Deltaproteobacteria bacterium]|nr:hypothetical protein [Deltaproteobacteria bacterium]